MNNSDTWVFPDVDLEADLIEKEAHTSLEDIMRKQQEHEFNNKHAELTVELEELKKEYATKINLVNQMLHKLENPMLAFDAEFSGIVQDIIKKVVKNIIHKEIRQTPSLINGMVEDIEKLIHQENGAVTVYLSEPDYKRFIHDNNLPNSSIHINSFLTEGDIIVKSNFAEVRALLNVRLDRIIRENL